MKREIKFRAWDTKSNDMYSDWKSLSDIENEGLILMQYTGLTNNGQDWYDGDILENDADWYQITWDLQEGRWEATGIKSTGESLALSELLSQETWVQGNIYENPELLSL